MRTSVAAAFLLLAACATTGRADRSLTAPGAGSYIAAAHLDASHFLPPPPAPDSPAQAADLAQVKADQALKGRPRWIQAQSDDDPSPYRAFGPVLGPGFTTATWIFEPARSLPRSAAPATSASRSRPAMNGSRRSCGRPSTPFIPPITAS